MSLLPVLLLAAALAARPPAPAAAPSAEPPAILVSRQLLAANHLAVGDVVLLAPDPSGARPRPFRIAGAYEPVPDPSHLGAPSLEARLHLPDLLALTGDPADAQAPESIQSINVKLVHPADAPAFMRDLAARVPGLVLRETGAPGPGDLTFVVLDRFHLAIATVTVIASSIFLLALMVMLVDERRDTVAILRLIGLRRRRIFIQVVAEGLVIALAGALFGVVLAVALEGGFNRFFQWRYDTTLVFVRVTPAIAARAVAVAVPLGIAASLAASWDLLRRGVMALARR
ncbi:MAG TPA: FtsX-like permease family protein [Vicinamibacteria bacterium]|nr:FtsX-like permease family protein [Vicinamibacteria bacterium]